MYKRKTFLHKLSVSLLFLAISYFSVHSVIGSRGLISLFELNEKLDIASKKLSILTEHENILEKRIKGLNEASLDLDLLDEQARYILGYAKVNEKIIYVTQEN